MRGYAKAMTTAAWLAGSRTCAIATEDLPNEPASKDRATFADGVVVLAGSGSSGVGGASLVSARLSTPSTEPTEDQDMLRPPG